MWGCLLDGWWRWLATPRPCDAVPEQFSRRRRRPFEAKEFKIISLLRTVDLDAVRDGDTRSGAGYSLHQCNRKNESETRPSGFISFSINAINKKQKHALDYGTLVMGTKVWHVWTPVPGS
jgi:hypothetical protein